MPHPRGATSLPLISLNFSLPKMPPFVESPILPVTPPSFLSQHLWPSSHSKRLLLLNSNFYLKLTADHLFNLTLYKYIIQKTPGSKRKRTTQSCFVKAMLRSPKRPRRLWHTHTHTQYLPSGDTEHRQILLPLQQPTQMCMYHFILNIVKHKYREYHYYYFYEYVSPSADDQL